MPFFFSHAFILHVSPLYVFHSSLWLTWLADPALVTSVYPNRMQYTPRVLQEASLLDGVDASDPLATPATIRSRPRQQADRQHLTFIACSLYPIAIDRDQRTPLAHSSPSIPSSSLLPSVCMPSSKVLVPHLFCSWKPRTLIANASIAMSRYRSLLFATPCYDPRRSLSSLLLVPPPPTLVPDSPRASSPPRYPPSLS